MSEYCRSWADSLGYPDASASAAYAGAGSGYSRSSEDVDEQATIDRMLAWDSWNTTAHARWPQANPRSMTAHRAPSAPSPPESPILRPPSPLPSDDDVGDADADDDGLSLASSDLEASWLDVRHSDGGTSVSGSASALDSTAISDIDPSSESERDWQSDIENDVSATNEDEDDKDDLDLSLDLTLKESPEFDDFQRSFIFPDPNSASASFTTVKDDTPVPSLTNTADDKSSFWNSRAERRLPDDKKEKQASVAPATSTSTPASFPVGPTEPRRKQWTALVSVLVFVVLFLKLGPSSIDITSLLSSTFSPAGPLDSVADVVPAMPTPMPATSQSRWLGPDLQVVRDALSALTTTEAEKPTQKPRVPQSPAQAAKKKDVTANPLVFTESSWFNSNKPAADVATTSSSALTTTKQRLPPPFHEPPEASLSDQFQSSVQLVSTYVSWALENLAALSVAAIDIFRTEIEIEIRYWRNLADDLYKSPQVRDAVKVAVDGASAGKAYSEQAIQHAFTRARRWQRNACANGRCSPDRLRKGASVAVSQAQLSFKDASAAVAQVQKQVQKSGYETLKKARRGLDNVIHAAGQAVDSAATEAHVRVYGAQKDGKAKATSKDRKVERSERKQSRRLGKHKSHKCKKSKSKSSSKSAHDEREPRRAKRKCGGFSGLMRGCDAAGPGGAQRG